MRAICPVLLAVVVLAGCGGSVSTTHSLGKTRNCLTKKGATIGPPKHDFVASTASGGAFRAYLHGRKGNFVTLSFGTDPSEAQSVAQGYDRFHEKKFGVAGILFTDQNVTLLWKLPPTSADADLVTKCLK